MAYIVTGHTGTAHVTASDDAAFNAGVVGSGDYVLAGHEVDYSCINGVVRFRKPFEVVMCGHHCRVEGIEEVSIPSTSQGMFRRDYIVGRYTVQGGVEGFEIGIVLGTPEASKDKAAAPALKTADLYTTSAEREMALVSVVVNGSEVESHSVAAIPVTSLSAVGAVIAQNVSALSAKVNAIGTVSTAILDAKKKISSGKSTVVLSLELDPGVYVVNGFTAWDKPSSSTVARVGIMSTDEFNNGATSYMTERQSVINDGAGVRIGCSDIVEIAQKTTINLVVYVSTSINLIGDNKLHSTGLRAVRIA